MANQGNAGSEDGLGLVEVVIAMFLLALVAVSILPALVNGLRFSAQQSSVATATRQVNGLIDQVRQNPDCATLGSLLGTAATPRSFLDGHGNSYTTQATIGSCSKGSTVSIHVTATQSGNTLATADALVIIPPDPVTSP
jgi:type II secretory pathway pseudopilin PulG